MTYFTSDQHFGNFNVIRLIRRPFKTVEEMDETMVERRNAKVRDGDTVYVLGDLFFRAATVEPILKRLKGHKHPSVAMPTRPGRTRLISTAPRHDHPCIA